MCVCVGVCVCVCVSLSLCASVPEDGDARDVVQEDGHNGDEDNDEVEDVPPVAPKGHKPMAHLMISLRTLNTHRMQCGGAEACVCGQSKFEVWCLRFGVEL